VNKKGKKDNTVNDNNFLYKTFNYKNLNLTLVILNNIKPRWRGNKKPKFVPKYTND